jgi:phospholipase/lecithinase/hemolysin
MKFLSQMTAAAVLALGGATAAALPSFSSMYVFGDSLSDNGNISALTLGLFPGDNYFQGRFSNGPNWVEILGLELNRYAVPEVTSFLGGTANGINYAYGGATSGTVNIGLPGVLPGLTQQVSAFSADFPGANADPDALYVVWAGANDYLSVVDLDPTSVVGNLVGAVQTLYDKGARNFLVPNLPDLGLVPRNIAGPWQDAFSFLTQYHNDFLAWQISELEANLADIEIVDMQVDDAIAFFADNAGLFGLSVLDQPCLVGGTLCAAPNEHLFWDDIHPTVVGHYLLSEVAKLALNEHFLAAPPITLASLTGVSAVPLPAAAWLLVPALAVLAGPARRRAPAVA